MAHSHGPPGAPDMAQLQAMLEAQTKPKELISFRAGQLNMSHNGTTVVADKRRGKLSLVLSMEDGLLHLQWVQRPTGQLQESDDIMIPPRSAAFEKVPECKTGRVILLRFKQGGRKRFFWLQEPKDDKSDAKDAEYIKKMNELIDNPPQPMADAGGAGGLGGLGGMAGMGGLGGMGGMGGDFDPSMAGLDGMDVDQAALMEMLSQQPAAAARAGTGAGTPANRSGSGAASSASGKTSETKSGSSAKPTGGARPNPNTANDALMAAMMNAAARDQAETAHGRHSLNDILDTERVLGAGLTDEEIQPLLQHLPEGQRTVGEFRAALRSPQFQQTLRGMSGVLNSSNFGPLVASFGLSPMGNIGVTGFMEAIESDAKRRAEVAAKAKSSGSGAGSAAAPPKPDDKKSAK